MSHRLTRRSALGAAVAGLSSPTPARAQATGSGGSIRIIVPFAPGGSTDAVARLVTPGLTRRLGQPVVVENRSGAGGVIGTDAVAKARPDGLTWLLTFDSHAVMPALIPRLPFNLTRDLDPVMLIGGAPYVVATRPDRPYRNLADLVAAAKALPDAISYGSPGNGTIGHLLMILLAAQVGASLTHVAFRGGAIAVTETIAGNLDVVMGSAALLSPQIAGGTLRPIVQFGPTRLLSLPDTQTAAEAGFRPWHGGASSHPPPHPRRRSPA